ncbi:MAG: Sulfatase domain-containing protein [Deltaproteobacteria bacterium]|nr:Sulfatase domain-containing protein [Deltaproteobacteria bacterium]
MSRTSFSIAAAIVAALIFTGFRLWLYFERRAELDGLTLGERLRLFWVGFRLDGVVVSRACVPVLLLEPALTAMGVLEIESLLLAYLGPVYFVSFFAEIAGLYFFRYYNCRLNYLVFEHGADREVIKTVLKAYPVLRIFLLSIIGAAISLLLVTTLRSAALPKNSAPLLWYWDVAIASIWLLIVVFATRGTFDHRVRHFQSALRMEPPAQK